MAYLALDLSKKSTGFALWADGWERPRVGHWQLGSEYTTDGQTFAKLHRNLGDLFKLQRFENLYFEEAITPAHLQGYTTIQTIHLAIGLAAHAQSFGYAKRCRIVKAVNIEHWRKHYIGSDVANQEKARVRRERKAGNKKASARDTLKRLTRERCDVLGIRTTCDDEADAVGILDYALDLNGIVPPWRENETLMPLLGVEAAE